MAGLEDTGIVEQVTIRHSAATYSGASPETPDVEPPDISFKRHGAEAGELTAPDGTKVKYWGFVDSDLPLDQQVASYPSPMIRVRKGQVVHNTLTSGKGRIRSIITGSNRQPP